jgi:hypothetical protein
MIHIDDLFYYSKKSNTSYYRKMTWQYYVYLLEMVLLKKCMNKFAKKLIGSMIIPKEKFFTPSLLTNLETIHVTDIWESEQDFNNFLDSKLKPALEKINAPMPVGGVYPIYNVNVFQGLESYRVK